MFKTSIAVVTGMIAVVATLTAAQAGPRYVEGQGAYQVASWWDPPRRPPAAVAAVRG